MDDPKIGERLLIDGATRAVFFDRDHRQYVLDDEGERIYGVWIYREEDHPDYLPVPQCKNTTV
jgi:hypothetical protein